MARHSVALLLAVSSSLFPAGARSEDVPGPTPVPPATQEPAAPSSNPPGDAPPAAPPAAAPAPQQDAQPGPAVASAPPGQWVYTQQYGWVWMPYADAYTYAPPDGYGEPYMYVFYPTHGWTWVVAPWVWGWGPWPYFGPWGSFRFAWYGHGWWRYPSRWQYRPGLVRGGFPAPVVRPSRSSSAVPLAPAPRGTSSASPIRSAPSRSAPSRGGGTVSPRR